MEEILRQLTCNISHYLQGFIHPRWLFGISFINSSIQQIRGFNHIMILFLGSAPSALTGSNRARPWGFRPLVTASLEARLAMMTPMEMRTWWWWWWWFNDDDDDRTKTTNDNDIILTTLCSWMQTGLQKVGICTWYNQLHWVCFFCTKQVGGKEFRGDLIFAGQQFL